KTSLPYIRVILNFFLATTAYPTYHWSLLFPACGPPNPRKLIAPICNLLRAVDAIVRNFGVCHVSLSTCLCLTLSTLVVHSLPPNHSLAPTFRPPKEVMKHYPSVLRLTGNDVFTFDVATQAIQLRTSVFGLPHQSTSLHALNFIQAQNLLFTNFLHFNMLLLVPRPTIPHIDTAIITSYTDSIHHVSTLLFSLLATTFSFESHSFLLSQPTNQGYKSLPLPSTNSSSSSSPLGAVKWKQF
ncbi:hypothetical protein MAM1_1211c11515, partial [Mucor ambiguus]